MKNFIEVKRKSGIRAIIPVTAITLILDLGDGVTISTIGKDTFTDFATTYEEVKRQLEEEVQINF